MTAKKTKPVKPRASSKKGGEKKPKKEPKEHKPQMGHNSGAHVNKPLVKIFEKYESLENNKKEINKAQRDLKAAAKSEHNVQTKNFTAEIALRKLDQDVRVQFEQGQKDLQSQLGYQFALGLTEGEEGEAGDVNADTGEKKGSFRDEALKQEEEDEGEPEALEE